MSYSKGNKRDYGKNKKSSNHNSSRDRKPQYNDEREEKPLEFNRSKSTLLQALTAGSKYTASGFNAVNVSVGNTDVITMHMPIYMEVSDLVGDAWTEIEDLITAALGTYYTTRGIAVSVTEANIEEYLKISLQLLAHLFTYKRYYDGAKLVTDKGISINPVVANRVYAFGAGDTAKITKIIAGTAATSKVEAGTDSNAVWAQSYLSYLPKIMTNSRLFMLMEYFFSGVHQVNRNNASAYAVFYEGLMNDNVTHAANWTILTGNLDALITATPEIIDILEILGFSNVAPVEYDWTRDINGLTLKIFDDMKDSNYLLNSQITNLTSSAYFLDADVLHLYKITANASMYAYSEHINIDSDVIAPEIIFSNRFLGNIQIPPYVVRVTETGAVNYVAAIMPSNFDVSAGTASDAVTLSASNNLAVAMHIYESFCGDVTTIVPQAVAITVDIGPIASAATVTATNYLRSYDDFYVSTDDTDMYIPILLSWLFGARYRANVQLVISSLKRSKLGL